MKMVMIAALVAAQLGAAASPAQAAEAPREELTTPQRADSPGARLREDVELNLEAPQALEQDVGSASASARAETAEEEKPRKGKSTGDKVLTGAAVVLGVAALAVGGLLVALFVN